MGRKGEGGERGERERGEGRKLRHRGLTEGERWSGGGCWVW